MIHFQNELFDCIQTANRQRATDLVKQWMAENDSELFVQDVLMPVLDRFRGEVTPDDPQPLASGYVAARITEDAMNLIAERRQRDGSHPSDSRGKIILGNIEDDFHALGRRILSTFLRADNWDVDDLGNDVPAEDFVDRAVEQDACLIGVSAMMYTTAKNISQVRKVLNDRGLQGQIKLAVGGAVFNLRPELMEEVGGDGSAPTALEGSELFQRLLNEVRKVEKV